MQTILLTCLVVVCFIVTRTTYIRIRQMLSKVSVVIIGAGPIGLTAALIASATKKVSEIIIYEEKCRNVLISRSQQIALDSQSVTFLTELGVDFDNIEGCWHDDDPTKTFYTRIGVFQDYILSILYKLETPVTLCLNSKFTKSALHDLEKTQRRLLFIVCEGVNGSTCRLLGLSEEFVQHSCKSYGAVAAIERKDQRQVPTPEIKRHNLTFDLSAYGKNNVCDNRVTQGFHLKIFGSYSHRYISLAVPKSDNKLVKSLMVILDQSVMRNIFVECFNTYKDETESNISVLTAIRQMKFSPRLFDIKLSHRVENVMYLEESDTFITVEGDAARAINFYSGLDINIGIRGLFSLAPFICLAAYSETEQEKLEALRYKSRHAQNVSLDFIKEGLKETMYS